MKYGSVCSGIEAATHAWHPLGWEASFFSEIEKFPRQVLAHHYPNTPLHGDFTTIQKGDYDPIELLVGGTPCQSFSVAGLRAGLNDPRGNLMLEFGALAKRLQPKWLVWENVPGVLSSNGGKDFGSFLAMLGELGYGFAYRILDAQHFGVPQRRRRVFVIGCLGDWRPAAAVLFESHSLQGHPAPSRKTGKGDTLCFEPRSPDGVPRIANGGVSPTLNSAQGGQRQPCVTTARVGSEWPADVASTLNASFGSKLGLENQHINSGAPLFVPAYSLQGSMIGREDQNGPQGDGVNEEVSFTLNTIDRHAVAYAFKVRGGCEGGGKGYLGSDEQAFTLSTGADQQLFQKMQVRRLMPIECERLQGFRDDFTNIPGASDSTRYKALGNSMAVPVMAWIGKRINLVESLQKELAL
jgi:DNA (cytosine-5)-methyltransferase 1